MSHLVLSWKPDSPAILANRSGSSASLPVSMHFEKELVGLQEQAQQTPAVLGGQK